MENSFLQLIKDGFVNYWNRPSLTDIDKVTYTYEDFAKKMTEIHLLFKELDINKGNKIAFCGPNSSHWAIAFFASMTYGAVPVTILHDFNADSIHRIVNHSESKILFVSSSVWKRLVASEMPELTSVVMIDDFSILKSLGGDIDMKDLFDKKFIEGFSIDDMYFHEENPNDLAILNYTSGTTSNPKGVMIPYRSLWSNTRFAIDNIPFVKAGDGFVSMLPMAHMYGLAFEVLLSVTKGSHLHFISKVPSPQIILNAFAQVKPTLVIAVPLIIEKIIRNKIFPVLEKQPINTLIKIPGIRSLIYKKIKNRLLQVFGGQIVEVVIGGAALNKEIGDFLTKIKFPYTVGYGMTECGPLVSYDYWATYRPKSCGKPVDRMNVKIKSDNQYTIPGEIIIKGDNVMTGYFKDPELTQKTIDKDGWLLTGDLGVLDEDGYIYIKGRSKTMILGASGQNIYPEEIEDFFNNSIFVSESLIVEDNKSKLVALIYPDMEYIQQNGISPDHLTELLEKELKQINTRLPVYSQVGRYILMDSEFEKTPKRSIKRFLYTDFAK